jgi:hypothetical protein
MDTDDLRRFESKIERIPGVACHVWAERCDVDGYGSMKVKGKTERAHRLAYEHYFGSAEGKHVLHRCDVPSCVNPDHLFLGTHAENVADMIAKGRQARGAKTRAPRRTRLSETQIIEIRGLSAAGTTQREIASKFGVTQANISLIVSKKNWAYV